MSNEPDVVVAVIILVACIVALIAGVGYMLWKTEGPRSRRTPS